MSSPSAAVVRMILLTDREATYPCGDLRHSHRPQSATLGRKSGTLPRDNGKTKLAREQEAVSGTLTPAKSRNTESHLILSEFSRPRSRLQWFRQRESIRNLASNSDTIARMSLRRYPARLLLLSAMSSLLLLALCTVLAISFAREQSRTAAILGEDIGSRGAAIKLEVSLIQFGRPS